MKARLVTQMNGSGEDLSDEEKWCLYLNHNEPDAKGDFFIRNCAQFPLDKIKPAAGRVIDMSPESRTRLIGPVLDEMEARIRRTLRRLVLESIYYLTSLSVVLQLGTRSERLFKLTNESLNLTHLPVQELQIYLDRLHSEGILLRHGPWDYGAPELVADIFTSETRGNIVEYHIFESRDDAERFLERLFRKAQKSVRVWDPYLSPATFQLLRSGLTAGKKPLVEILTSCPAKGTYSGITENEIRMDVSQVRKKARKVSIKYYSRMIDTKCEPAFHDRHVIIDLREVWTIGSSLNSIGGKKETAIQLGEQNALIVNAAFEGLWASKGLEGYEMGEIPKVPAT